MASISQLNIEGLKQRLASHGETVPKGWSKMQMVLRLMEIEGEDKLDKVSVGESPLRLWEVKINKASRLKKDMIELATNMGMQLSGNETIEKMKLGCLNLAMRQTEGHPADYVGFGEHSALKYQDILENQPSYCRWVLKTEEEGDCSPRLKRLAMWLKTKDVDMTAKRPTTNKKPVMKHENTSSSSGDQMNQQVLAALGEVMQTVKNLSQDMDKLKTESKEAKRRTHISEDVTTMSSP